MLPDDTCSITYLTDVTTEAPCVYVVPRTEQPRSLGDAKDESWWATIAACTYTVPGTVLPCFTGGWIGATLADFGKDSCTVPLPVPGILRAVQAQAPVSQTGT